MNDIQLTKYAELLAEYSTRADLSNGTKSLIQTLACVIDEEEFLQEFCNKNRTTYQVVGKSGDTYSRMRPEWQQLKEARVRKQAMVATLERLIGTAKEVHENVEADFT